MRRAGYMIAAVLAAGFLTPGVSHAQTLEDIIAMNLKAKGGLEKIKATSTVRLTGRVAAKDPDGNDVSATTTMLAKRPNLMRREQTANGRTIVSAFDGKSLWMAMGTMPPRAMSGSLDAYAQQGDEFDSVFVDYKEKGHSIVLVGKEKRDGRDVYHLRVKKKGGPPQHYYLDAETALEKEISFTVDQGGTPTTISTELGDYREVDGRQVPFSIRQVVNGTVGATTRIDKVEFNVPADDSLFRMPASK